MSLTSFLSNVMGPVAPQSEEEAKKRYEEEQKAQEALNKEEASKPVTQTLKIDPKTGEQTLTVSGSPEDLSAANPLTPTVAQPGQPVAPVAPAQPPAPVAQQMPPQAGPAPVAPQQAEAVQLPQPGPGVQVAGPTQLPPQPQGPVAPKQVPAQVQEQMAQLQPPAAPAGQLPMSAEQQYVDVLASNDKQKLARLYQDPAAPEYAKRAAADALQYQFKKEQDEQKAQAAIQSAITSGNGSDFARLLRTKGDEGSYVKAYLYARLGLNDLASQEQQKLGAGSKWQPAIGKGGERALVQYDASGMPTVGYDEAGRRLTGDELASFAVNSSIAKGAVTGQTFGKAPINGENHVISHTVLPNGAGVIWKDETTGETLKSAPAGYAPVGQQNPVTQAAIRTASQVEAKMRKANADAAALKATQPFTEDDILREKERVLNGAMSTIGAGGEPVVPPTRENAAGTFNAGRAPANENAVQVANRLGLPIISGVRDQAKQQQLWDESVRAGRTGFTATGNPIARPGTSAHETANAVDLDYARMTPEQKQLAAANGLIQPHANDTNHFELGGRRPAAPVSPQNVMAERIANYEMPPPSVSQRNSAGGAAMMNDVLTLNPNYDPSKWETAKKTRQAFTTGAEGKTIRAANTFIDHSETLKQATDALANGNIKVFNTVTQELAKQLGKPQPGNFEAVKEIYGDELIKAVTGSAGALGDREAAKKRLDAANSPAQLFGVINYYNKLMGGQVKSLRKEYEEAGLKDFDAKLLPHTKAVLDKLESGETVTRSKW